MPPALDTTNFRGMRQLTDMARDNIILPLTQSFSKAYTKPCTLRSLSSLLGDFFRDFKASAGHVSKTLHPIKSSNIFDCLLVTT